jgi:hypothetical protein
MGQALSGLLRETRVISDGDAAESCALVSCLVLIIGSDDAGTAGVAALSKIIANSSSNF